ncbi:uncharacterized protein LOC113109192 [Carassius auratus]|uniref:Uncharacterized protein LOC113109192 n=1 Tax=Carassius auratus TaxID=7957 RepID=A0A6P6Q650_CARAU|nr:uncharacterized protein LOC113109192 [Carassius auratus]
MSLKEQATSLPQTETSDRPSRHRRTPRHLEEYHVDYGHHRPALFSSPTEEVQVEQRGAAAAVGLASQSRTVSRQGEHPDTSSMDLLSMSSLRKMLKTISDKEKDEAADMAALHSNLQQYEKRQRRRKELMEHITSFLREEEDEEDDQSEKHIAPPVRSPSVTSPRLPPSSHTTPSQSPDIELPTQGCVSDMQKNASKSPVEAEDFNSGFVPICPVSSIPLYSPVSSGTIPTVSHQQQPATRAETVPPLFTKQSPIYDAGKAFQPQVQPPLMAPKPVYQHLNAVYGYLTGSPSQQQFTALPTASFATPHYTLMTPAASVSQTQPRVPVMTLNPPAFDTPSLQPFNKALNPTEYFVPQRPLHAAPQPKIPDFVNDNEREFANLKLALDNLLEPHAELDEKYKYHILLEHLKLPEAQMFGQSCRHHLYPYSAAMQALQLQYGQPHQLAQSEIAAILTAPEVKPNDAHSFQSFALRVHLLVSMLLSLEGTRGMELNCCSHVDRLLSKLPKYLRDGFIEFLQLRGKLNSPSINPYNLQDFAGWLQVKAQQQRLSSRLV